MAPSAFAFPAIMSQLASGQRPQPTMTSGMDGGRNQPTPSSPKPSLLSRLATGANKFSEELLNPTNAIGRFGAHLGAASGSVLGKATLGAMQEQRDIEEDMSGRAILHAQMAEMARKANQPQIQTIGGVLGMVDKDNGQFTPTYTAPTEAERYASSLGVDQSQPDWGSTIQDFVLRSSGPTAYGFDVDLENVRQGNREEIEQNRQRNRLTLKTTPTYAQAQPRAPRAPSAGRSVPGGIPGGAPVVNVRTPAEASKLASGTRFRTPDGRIKVVP